MNLCFKARWGKSLILISVLATAVCFGAAVYSWTKGHTGFRFWLPLSLPFAALPFAALPFMVRGYHITPERLEVRRLFWKTSIALADETSAEHSPGAMTGCLRIFGNGGLFSFTGWFWNRRHGIFRVFATDSRNMVVVKTGGKTVMVSPMNPEEFIRAVIQAGGKERSDE